MSYTPQDDQPHGSSSITVLCPTGTPTTAIIAGTVAIEGLFFVLVLLAGLGRFTGGTKGLFFIFRFGLGLVLATKTLRSRINVRGLAGGADDLLGQLEHYKSKYLQHLSNEGR